MATIDSMDVRDFDLNSQMAAQERLPGDRKHAPAVEEAGYAGLRLGGWSPLVLSRAEILALSHLCPESSWLRACQ
jgi:hypothetical protein